MNRYQFLSLLGLGTLASMLASKSVFAKSNPNIKTDNEYQSGDIYFNRETFGAGKVYTRINDKWVYVGKCDGLTLTYAESKK